MTVFTDKVARYNSRLMSDLQIDKVQAAGIWGNLGTETGGFAALQEIKPTVAGSRGGYGWMQWTGPRRKKYEAWCQVNLLNPADDETNYKYLIKETTTDEAHSLGQLRKTTSIDAATETFMKQNLRPGAPHLENRISWAKKAFEVTSTQASTDKKTGVVVGTILGSGTAIVATPPHVWPWIVGSLAIAGVVGWFLVHRYHEHEKQEELSKVVIKPTKKGKKNG